jgi:hypothetical protein
LVTAGHEQQPAAGCTDFIDKGYVRVHAGLNKE